MKFCIELNCSRIAGVSISMKKLMITIMNILSDFFIPLSFKTYKNKEFSRIYNAEKED